MLKGVLAFDSIGVNYSNTNCCTVNCLVVLFIVRYRVVLTSEWVDKVLKYSLLG